MIIYPPNNPIAFSIFNLNIRYYGIIMAIAIFMGFFVATKVLKKKYDPIYCDYFLDFAPWVVLIAILGARVFYVLGAFEFYKNNPLEIVMFNHGGLSLYGALFFGSISLAVFTKKLKLDTIKYFDVFALALPLCQSIGRFGNFINQEAFGSPYQGFLKLYVDLSHRPQGLEYYSYFHPTFLYESVLDLILFAALLIVFLKFKHLKKGTILCLYLFCYGIIRIFTEHFRIDSVLNIYSMPVASLISILVVIVSGLFLFKILKK